MKKNIFLMMLLASVIVLHSCSTDDEDSGSGGGTWSGVTQSETVSSSLDDNNVLVTWNDSATVQVSSNLSGVVSAQIKGGNVTLLADDDLAEEVTYTLQGTSTSGSLYMDGSYKATFVLNGLTLVSPDSAAINIRNGKRINVELADGTTNTLMDGSGGSQKACMMVKGHTEFSGGGSLTLTGKTGHAFWGKEYVLLKVSTGKITVPSAVGDGFNVNQYFQMNGGELDISGVGDDGIQVSYKTDDDDNVIPLSEDEDNTSEFLVKGGVLSVATSAADSKGIKTEGNITICEDKGTTVIVVSNTGASSSSGGNRPGGSSSSSSSVASKAIKAEGNISITAGSLSATSSSHEGMEAKGTIDISGGVVYVQSSDDAINSGSHLTVTGGYVCAYSTGNDGLDANGNCYLKGGTVYAIGSGSPEVAIDANTESGYKLYLTGGTVVAVGGLESGSSLTQSCYQASSWSKSTWYTLSDTSGNTFTFKTPSSGGSGMVVSTAGTPSLKSGVTSSGGTTIFNGMGTVNGTVSGGTSVSLSSYSSGGGGQPGGRW
ncbi:MAG: carbohydrate-binding domain-containing protein [Bacteroidaceae bacterium]|nr:carbohydrate-binding domain-containing protein [Bacteroidaceae bacterium]